MSWRACQTCGRPFKPRHPRHTRCPEHEQHGRKFASPTTRAQTAEYAQNRNAVLAGNPRCHWCGAPATTADHLTPVARGGTNHLENIVAACRRCNSSRQANPEWQPPRGRKPNDLSQIHMGGR